MEQQTARIGVITSVRAVQHFDIDVLSVSIFALPSGRAETLARKAALFENICFVCCRPHGCMSKRRDVFG